MPWSTRKHPSWSHNGTDAWCLFLVCHHRARKRKFNPRIVYKFPLCSRKAVFVFEREQMNTRASPTHPLLVLLRVVALHHRLTKPHGQPWPIPNHIPELPRMWRFVVGIISSLHCLLWSAVFTAVLWQGSVRTTRSIPRRLWAWFWGVRQRILCNILTSTPLIYSLFLFISCCRTGWVCFSVQQRSTDLLTSPTRSLCRPCITVLECRINSFVTV